MRHTYVFHPHYSRKVLLPSLVGVVVRLEVALLASLELHATQGPVLCIGLPPIVAAVGSGLATCHALG